MATFDLDTSPELRPESGTVTQDWARVAVYLAGQGLHLSLEPDPRQFAGGLANLNYLVSIDDKAFVLRRPPMGELPVGAYDMAREYRVLSRLSSGFPLAPRALHLCTDPTIIGAPFQIVEYRQGFTVRSTLPPPLQEQANIGAHLAHTLLDVLVRLHTLDPATVDLHDLGRPDGFIERAINGWIDRANRSAEGRVDSPCHVLIAELGVWLRSNRVPAGPASLIHNDIKLDNIVLDGKTLDPVAVLDWDQCTRGDSLFDLATTLSYCSEPGDPPAMHELKQIPGALPGFPSRRDMALRYSAMTQRDLSDFKFYRVLAIFKLAIIFQQLHQRFRSGQTHDRRYAGFGDLTDGLLDFAHRVVLGEYF